MKRMFTGEGKQRCLPVQRSRLCFCETCLDSGHAPKDVFQPTFKKVCVRFCKNNVRIQVLPPDALSKFMRRFPVNFVASGPAPKMSPTLRRFVSMSQGVACSGVPAVLL